MRVARFVLTVLLGGVTVAVNAAPQDSPVAGAPEVPAAVTAALARLVPEESPTRVRPAPLPGLWEVAYGARIYYLTADGAHLVGGPVVALATRRNLTEEALRGLRRDLLGQIPEADMVVFAPPKPAYTVTVFTDVDCHYCRKLHAEIAAYNAQGIAVRYLAFPRTGLGTPSAHKAEAVWCSKDRNDALTRAKRGEEVKAPGCTNPVAREHQLGIAMDISGTPALVLESGRLVSGYVPPARLRKMLEGE